MFTRQLRRIALFVLVGLVSTVSTSFAGYSGMEPSISTHVISYSAYYEEPGLPPHLMVVFHVDCSEAFEGVVRTDRFDSRTGSMIISIGGQIRALKTECQGSQREIIVDAGPTYSGRSFEVRPF